MSPLFSFKVDMIEKIKNMQIVNPIIFVWVD